MLRPAPTVVLVLTALLGNPHGATAQLQLKERPLVKLSPNLDGQKGDWSGDVYPVDRMGFSPDGRSLARVLQSEVLLWDVSTGNQSAVLKTPLSYATHLKWNFTGTALAVAGVWSNEAKRREVPIVVVWDMKTRKQSAVLRANQQLSALAFSPDGTTLATTGDDGYVQLWDLATGKERAILPVPVFRTDVKNAHLVYSPNGKLLAYGGSQMYFWDTETEQGRKSLEKEPDRVWDYDTSYGIVFTPDSKRLIAPFHGQTRDTDTGKYSESQFQFNGITFSHNGKVQASRHTSRVAIELSDFEAGKSIVLEDAAYLAVFAADDKTLTALNKKGQLISWEVTWGKAPGK